MPWVCAHQTPRGVSRRAAALVQQAGHIPKTVDERSSRKLLTVRSRLCICMLPLPPHASVTMQQPAPLCYHTGSDVPNLLHTQAPVLFAFSVHAHI